MSPIDIRPGVRRGVTHLILLAGGTGSGKTESSMQLATGMSGGAKFAVIDTERGRALHKADDYTFDHAELDAPFTPERYAEALLEVDALGYPVIIVDSGSHEYDGEGGVLDIQESEYQRLGARESVKMVSWATAKQRHKVWRNALLRTRAHVIVCHRAEDKIEIGKDAQGKTVIRPKQSLTGAEGWIPICERRLPFEATISLLFTADAPGVPKPIKLERRHEAFVPLDRPIDADVGRALAAWAAGAGTVPEGTPVNGAAAEATTSVAAAPSLATREQREELVRLAHEHGLDKAGFQAIISQVTGQTSTAKIQTDQYQQVVDLIEAVPA